MTKIEGLGLGYKENQMSEMTPQEAIEILEAIPGKRIGEGAGWLTKWISVEEMKQIRCATETLRADLQRQYANREKILRWRNEAIGAAQWYRTVGHRYQEGRFDGRHQAYTEVLGCFPARPERPKPNPPKYWGSEF